MQSRLERQRQVGSKETNSEALQSSVFTRQDRREELSGSGEIISPIKLGRTGDKASKIYKEISDEGNRKSY